MTVAYFRIGARKLVQGEIMKKRRNLAYNGELPVYGIFFAGFLAGVLFPNLMWKFAWRQKTAASMYLLAAFADHSLEKGEYFLEVLRMRGSMFLIAAFSGISVFGVPLAVMGALYLGFQTGMLMTVSILQFGLQGGVIGLGAMFPQYLFYFPCFFLLLRLIYMQSLEIWRNRGLFPQSIIGHVFRILGCAGLCLGGILLETWCNPPVMEVLMKSLKLF